MSIKLALDVNGIIYRMGDKVELYLKDKNGEPISGTISGIFKSVHPPYEIRINLKELPIHESVGVNEVDYIYKVY